MPEAAKGLKVPILLGVLGAVKGPKLPIILGVTGAAKGPKVPGVPVGPGGSGAARGPWGGRGGVTPHATLLAGFGSSWPVLAETDWGWRALAWASW